MARTQVASDGFVEAGSSNVDLHSHNSWVALNTTGYIFVNGTNDNVLAGFSTANALMPYRWGAAGTFSDDQYAKLTIGGLNNTNGNNRCGPAVRCSGDVGSGATDYYALCISDNAASGGSHTTELIRVNNGTVTVLASFSNTWANGDTVELEVTGQNTATQLKMFRNGAQISTTYTDNSGSALNTGKPGLTMRHAGSPSSTLDDFDAGDVTADGTAPTVSTQPTDETVTEPAAATFDAAFTGSPTPTYQWQRQAGGVGGWSNVGGGTSEDLTTGATTVSGGSWNDGDRVRCTATNASGSVTTNEVTLHVNAPTTYSITAGPFDLESGLGRQLDKAVVYSLYLGGEIGALDGITPIEGVGTTDATTGELEISGLDDAGDYLLIVEDEDGGYYANQVTAS